MDLTVITHIYNESFLLPFWIRHHREIFDRGIVIDYHSSDGSREIFDELAPSGWEWVESSDDLFYAEGCDAQVMQNERRFPDWKMALNVTEFLFEPNLHTYLQEFDRANPGCPGLMTKSWMMVDRECDRAIPPSHNTPLVLQRTYGYEAPNGWGRDRLIHRCADGAYHPGRHRTNQPVVRYHDNNLHLLWFNYSPFDCIKDRKLQIQRKIPQRDIDLGRGHHHLISEDQLEEQFKNLSVGTNYLLGPGFDDYRGAYERFEAVYG